ncbi:TnsD family Tn7-like transposition protein [Psychromonas sp. 14N.309.X.WAT.B.A12]|uniref:TnsD family Tn7-like transposition protein n=1 Tax=Psychromonas sp. 14N.309.X.WAT.B.A12 TaxID=2998322 RepID=UPI0025B1E572|nr:TnsD family Tn7-like transposition protein [Psychromonas sp. 14N.309.X.WAT.B.A12]MDN2662642.1 TnsD family Tn7-like transposition protein [Psychromonas sp. 14N.309.X.WAT.B.A12]
MTWNVKDFCPELLPNETVYSWVTRWIQAVPFPQLKESTRLVIGSSNKQRNAIFPSFLPILEAHSGKTIKSLIEGHTIIPYFKSFCEEKSYKSIIKDIYKGDSSKVHLKLPFNSGRIFANPDLQICPICSDNDIHQYGINYFHVIHQLPGVQVCIHHRVELLKIKRIPCALNRPPILKYGNKDTIKNSTETQLKLALLSTELLNNDDNLTGSISQYYTARFIEFKLTTDRGGIDQKLLYEVLRYYYQDHMKNKLFDTIFSSDNVQHDPRDLLCKGKTHFHPLKHLILIAFLFDNIKELVDYIAEIKSIKNKPLIIPYPPTMINIINALVTGFSLKKISQSSGMSACKLKQIAISNHITINQREKTIFRAEKKSIKSMLKRGKKTNDIAAKIPCSIDVVTKILDQSPKIQAQRNEYLFTRKRAAARLRLITTMRVMEKELLTRNNIYAQDTRTYRWLFKRDREWLEKMLPKRYARKKH